MVVKPANATNACNGATHMKHLVLATAIALVATLSIANAGPEPEHRGHIVNGNQWQMNDIGRNHGVVGGLMPKCNPHVSPECARLYPCLLRGLDYCLALRAQKAARRH
jgi:hypothetical protein